MTVTITITVDPPDEALENRDPADWTAGYLAGLAVAHGLIVRHSGVRLWPAYPPEPDPVETCDGDPVLAEVTHVTVCDNVLPAAVDAILEQTAAARTPDEPESANEDESPLMAEDGPAEPAPAEPRPSGSHRVRQHKAAASRATVPLTGRLCSACGATTAECRDTPAGANCCPDCTNPLHRARRTGSGS